MASLSRKPLLESPCLSCSFLLSFLFQFPPEHGGSEAKSRSYREHSLSPQEFCDFPLVKMFQQSFIDGVDKVCKVIGERKKSTVA